jgi:hypothetical protein
MFIKLYPSRGVIPTTPPYKTDTSGGSLEEHISVVATKPIQPPPQLKPPQQIAPPFVYDIKPPQQIAPPFVYVTKPMPAPKKPIKADNPIRISPDVSTKPTLQVMPRTGGPLIRTTPTPTYRDATPSIVIPLQTVEKAKPQISVSSNNDGDSETKNNNLILFAIGGGAVILLLMQGSSD